MKTTRARCYCPTVTGQGWRLEWRWPWPALLGGLMTFTLLLASCSGGATASSSTVTAISTTPASNGAATSSAATGSPSAASRTISGPSSGATSATSTSSLTTSSAAETATKAQAAPTTPAAPSPTGGSATDTANGSSATTATARQATPTAGAGTASTGDSWLTYHRTPDRAGNDPTSPSFQTVHSAWQSPQLDGDIYAEPLLDHGHLYVVTENDTFYSLDAHTGQVQWQQHVANPVAGSDLPCGDINPSGITGTPVIDPASDVIFAVAFEQPGKHELFALDLATGAVRYHVSIDPAGANPIVQQQRSALAIANGMVYVAYGGLDGDCGQYHGYIVAASAANGAVRASYQVPTQREGAIWAPAGPAVDGSGNLYVATGNGSSTTTFDYGDSVIKLSPALKVLDWFAPTNWAQLNRTDLDIGSISPLLLPNNLIFQIGKGGEGYLLHTDHLGQIGGQAFAAPVCASGYGAFGSTAYAAPYIYVPCRNGLVALRLAMPATFSVAWSDPGFAPDSPVVGGGVVWVVNPSQNALVGLDAATGKSRFQEALPRNAGGLPHFIAPTIAAGTVYTAAGRTVVAYAHQ